MNEPTEFVMELAILLQQTESESETKSDDLNIIIAEKIREHFVEKEIIYWSSKYHKYFIQHSLLDFIDQTEIALLEAVVAELPHAVGAYEKSSAAYKAYTQKTVQITSKAKGVFVKKGILVREIPGPRKAKFSELNLKRKVIIVSWFALIPFTVGALLFLAVSCLDKLMTPVEGSGAASMPFGLSLALLAGLVIVAGAVPCLMIRSLYDQMVYENLWVQPPPKDLEISDKLIRNYFITQQDPTAHSSF